MFYIIYGLYWLLIAYESFMTVSIIMSWIPPLYGTKVFNFKRSEVKSFLISNACFWINEYHIDGLRVDAVSSMIYLDFGRKAGEWIPNKDGGNINLEAIEFLQDLSKAIHSESDSALLIAEESTSYPKITEDPSVGGLGFDYKWNMGWMNNVCHYLKMDPFFRKDNHKDLTFNLMFAFSENYVLPISHDEVVHMKGSLVNKMPGVYEDQLRWLKGFYLYMMTHPGKKLLFMGPELGQWKEWNYETQLDWELLTQERNRRTKDFFKMMNHFYLENSELWEKDLSWEGFEWLVVDDNRNNVIAYARKNKAGDELICIVNFSPVKFEHYRIPVLPYEKYLPIINTDDAVYGGEDFGYKEPVLTEWIHKGKMDSSICVKLPPRAGLILKASGKLMAKPKATPSARNKRARAKLRATQKTNIKRE